MRLPIPRPTRILAFAIPAALATLPVTDAADGLGPLRGALVVFAPAVVALLLVLRRPALDVYLGHALAGAAGIAAGTLGWGYAFGPDGLGEALLLPFQAFALWVMSAALAYIGGTLAMVLLGGDRSPPPTA